MDDDKYQKESPLLYLFFTVCGALLIITSFVVRAQKLNAVWADISVDVLLNVGASLIATAGVAYLYQRFGTNSLSYYLEKLLQNFTITQRAMDLGIKDMWRERRHIPNDMWNTFTGAATSEVWLMGMAELGFAEDPKFQEIVSNGTARGCNYRFLLLDPDSASVSEVDEREGGAGQLQGRIRLSIHKFSEMQVKNQKKKGKVEVRIYTNVPQVSIVRSDDEFLITPYMYYCPGNSSFTLLIHKTPDGISEHYVKFYNEIWKNAVPPTLNSGKYTDQG
jgi:hypothetical protein